MKWVDEVGQLHDFFEGWFAGRDEDMQRVERVLDTGFTIVSPDGVERSRDDILASIASGRGRDPELRITTSDHEELAVGPEMIVARYIERHHRFGEETRRVSTVVFRRSANTPNGVIWLSVHETWMPAV